MTEGHIDLENGDYSFDYAGDMANLCLSLTESNPWAKLCEYVALYSHATSNECWEGMEDALREYLEGIE